MYNNSGTQTTEPPLDTLQSTEANMWDTDIQCEEHYNDIEWEELQELLNEIAEEDAKEAETAAAK